MINLLADTADDAFKALLEPVAATALSVEDGADYVYTAKRSGLDKTPNITISSEVGSEEVYQTGLFWVTTMVSVVYHAADQPEHSDEQKAMDQALLSAVNDLLCSDDLESQLTAAAESLHVFEASIQRTGQPREYGDNLWRDTTQLRFLACANDLS